MVVDEASTTSTADAAEQFSTLRTELVALLEELPETRLSKLTMRQGWTLRHELSWLAASDAELRERLDHGAAVSIDERHWRRVRGQAMHSAQELRLAALREHLAASGEQVAASLAEHADRLTEASAGTALETHSGHAATAIAAVRTAMGK